MLWIVTSWSLPQHGSESSAEGPERRPDVDACARSCATCLGTEHSESLVVLLVDHKVVAESNRLESSRSPNEGSFSLDNASRVPISTNTQDRNRSDLDLQPR